MPFAYALIDLAVSTSSLLEHLFLGCSLLEPSYHAVKKPTCRYFDHQTQVISQLKPVNEASNHVNELN